MSLDIQYRSKVSYHHLAKRVLFLSRLVSRETRWVWNEMCLVSRKCTGSTNTSLLSIFKPVLCIIVPICAVDMIFILISNVCVPCYKNFFLCLQAGFLRLLVVACSWILQGTRTSLQAGKLFFCTKLNVFVSGYCRVNKCRQLHSQLMKIATVSGLKNCGGCSSFALNKIRKIKSLNPRVIAWIKTHVTIVVVYEDFKPYLAISMNYFISFANCC